MADARRLAAEGHELLEQYHKSQDESAQKLKRGPSRKTATKRSAANSVVKPGSGAKAPAKKPGRTQAKKRAS